MKLYVYAYNYIIFITLLAGLLTEEDNGDYLFVYDETYIQT